MHTLVSGSLNFAQSTLFSSPVTDPMNCLAGGNAAFGGNGGNGGNNNGNNANGGNNNSGNNSGNGGIASGNNGNGGNGGGAVGGESLDRTYSLPSIGQHELA